MRIRGIRWASPLAEGLGMALPLQSYIPMGRDIAHGRDATEAGAGNALTFAPMPYLGGYGMRGDGSDRYLSLVSLLDFMTNSEGSISAWVQTDADNGENGLWSLGAGESRYDYGAGLWGHAALSTFGTTSGSMSSVDTSKAHLLTITMNAAGTWRAYIDGKQWTQSSLTFVSSHTTWKLGASATSSTYALAGRLAHFLAWDRALSAAEVWALYNPRTRWDLYDRGSVFYALSEAEVAGTTHEVAISLPGSAGVSSARLLALERAASFPGSAGVSADSDSVLERAATFAGEAAIATAEVATFEHALSLPGSAGLAIAVDNAIERAISLGSDAGLSADELAALERTAAFAGTAGLALVDDTTVERAVSVAGSAGLGLASDSATEVSLSLDAQAAVSLSEVAIREASIALAGSAGVSASQAGSAYERPVLLAAVAAISHSVTATLERAAALGAEAGFAVSASYTYEAGIALAATATITASGTVVDVQIVTPEGRTLFVQADGRTLTIQADDRTLTIRAED